MPSSPDTPADWAAILDEFEAELARVDGLTAELADAGVVLPFREPSDGVGPIPEAMRERALTVLAAQRAAMQRLERLRADLAQHIGVTRAAARRPDVAVYLDRTA